MEIDRLQEYLRLIFVDKTKLRDFLEQKGQPAQVWLDRMQELADYPNISPELRSSIFTTLLRLSKNSGLHPRCLTIQNVRKMGDYPIAAGGFGDVWKGVIGGSTELVCLKIVKIYLKSDVEKSSKEYIREAVVWRQLKHPNLLPFLGIYHLEHNQQLCLISPWMEKGNLVQYLRSTPREDVEHYTLVHDVAAGLHYLHSKKFIHGDLKGVNILIMRSGRACIGDFGLSRVADTHGLRITTSTSRPVGTARWLAPELLIGGGTSNQSDIYAYGCVCFEIFTGLPPFPELANDMAVAFHVAQGKRMSRPEHITELNDDIWVIMESCWNIDLSARPTAEDVLSKVKPYAQNTMGAGSDWSDSLSSEIWNNIKHQAMDEVLVLSHVGQSVSEKEKKRQEVINEVILNEKHFVRDMVYLRDIWIERLQRSEVIPADRRTSFLEQVFWNVYDIIAVNTRLRDALVRRREQYAVVEIGDIFLDAVSHFGLFVSYGAHQLYGKFEFEKEKNANPAFAAFVDNTECLPESRNTELNVYLTKPITHLARYPLLLEVVIKYTPEDNPDKAMLPRAVSMIGEFLARVNAELGKTENRFNLIQLGHQLVFKPGKEVDLRLTEEGREMTYTGRLNNKNGEVDAYLLDHALLFTKRVKANQSKVYRWPIPLELLYISCADDLNNATNGNSVAVQTRQGPMKKFFTSREQRHTPVVPVENVPPEAKGTFWISFTHLGRKHYGLTLWANSRFGMRKWMENILKQQQALQDKSMVFEMVPLSEGFFTAHNKVNCAASFLAGKKVVYGTDDGVYISDLRVLDKDPVKVLPLVDVVQIDVLEEYLLLIVLSERQVITFPLDALDPMDPMAGLKRAKLISTHTSFFKAGQCMGRIFVCIVKSSPASSTIKVLEPIDPNIRGHSRPTFRKLVSGGTDTLKSFTDFYLPVEASSIHYLRTKICVGGSQGFEVVDLDTLDTQRLLDPNDESLEFVRKKDNLRPMAIYRIQNEFLICYDEFAFYVDKTGRRSRKEFMVHWEGTPTDFALHDPYVLAFEPFFVEIRHVETGLCQVIQGRNLRLLFAGNPSRDQILMFSDNRVLALRTLPAGQ